MTRIHLCGYDHEESDIDFKYQIEQQAGKKKERVHYDTSFTYTNVAKLR